MTEDEPEDAPEPPDDPSAVCAECGGGCCSFDRLRVAFAYLDPGQRYDSFFLEYERADDLLLADGSPMDAEWYIWDPDGTDRRFVVFRCNHVEGALCSVYEDRPEMCRSFRCEALKGESTVQEWVDKKSWDEPPDFRSMKNVTNRVMEILRRRSVEA